MCHNEIGWETVYHLKEEAGAKKQGEQKKAPCQMAWIETPKGVPYFVDDQGQDWTPIGQNDAITWPELAGCFRRRDLATTEAYLSMLARHGVTCLRLMLEYCQREHLIWSGRPATSSRIWSACGMTSLRSVKSII